MKKSTSSTRLPISRKAYKGFVDRIKSLLGDTTTQASSLVAALDLYLEGDERYAIGLDASLQLPFAFLRQDIDVAMERSRKARRRAAMRKQAAEAAKVEVFDADVYRSEVNTAEASDAEVYDCGVDKSGANSNFIEAGSREELLGQNEELLGQNYELAGVEKNDKGVCTPPLSPLSSKPLSRRERRAAFMRNKRKQQRRDAMNQRRSSR